MRHKNYIRLLAFVLAALLIVGMLAAVIANATVAPGYTDTKDHWAVSYIAEATAEGWMNGTGAGRFSPDRPLTRAEAVTILWRAEGSPPALHMSFTDVHPKAYYAQAVKWAADNSLVKGVSEDSFAPDDNITREQFVTILYRYADLGGLNTEAGGSLAAFRDPNLTPWSADAVRWAVSSGVITGVKQNGFTYLLPKALVTRAQACVMLCRMIGGNHE